MTLRKLLTAAALLAFAGLATLHAQLSSVPTQSKGVVNTNLQKKNTDDTNVRSIEGVVSDANRNLIPKAIVQLKDMRTLQIRSFITSTEGEYHFAGLRMDTDYELKAVVGDQTSPTKRVSSFESRKTVTVNLQVEK